jgi:hypothetical protein
VVAVIRRDPAQHLGADHTVVVVAAVVEEHAAEADGRGGRRGGQRVLDGLHDLAVGVDDRRPAVGEHHVGMLVERGNAALDEVTAVEVVVRCPLEELAAAVPEDDVVIELAADVAGLSEVADPAVLGRVLPADVLRGVGGRVVGDDQLEVLVRLAEQRFDRFGEVRGSVVDGQADSQPRGAVRGHPFS